MSKKLLKSSIMKKISFHARKIESTDKEQKCRNPK